MSLVLSTETNQGQHRVLLMPGQLVAVGSSPWCDLCVADEKLAATHFRVHLGSTPVVYAQESCSLTFAGKPVQRIDAPPPVGFQAGNSSFRIDAVASQDTYGSKMSASQTTEPIRTNVGESPTTPAGKGGDLAVVASPSNAAEGGTDSKVARDVQPSWLVVDPKSLGVDSASMQQIASAEGPRDAAVMLQDGGEVLNALRVWVASLEIGSAIQGACRLIESSFTGEVDGPVDALVATWCDSPNETKRLEIQKRLPQSPEQPLDWIYSAVNWTGGSLADTDSPPVPPPCHLPYLAVVAAVQLFAATQPLMLGEAMDRYLQLTSSGKETV